MPSVTRRLLAGLLLAGIPATFAACRVWAPSPTPSAEDAAKFVATVNESILELAREQQQAGWVAATYITPDTQAITARANRAYIDAVARSAKDAARFNDVQVSADVRRQLDLLKTTLVVVTPSDPKQARELTDAHRVHGGGLRQRQVVQGPVAASHLPRHRADHRGDGDIPRPRAAARGVGRLAHGLSSDEEGLRPLHAAGQPRREGTGLCRHRRALAREVRHAAGGVHERARSALGAGAAALRVAARLRANEAAREVWRPGSGEGPDSRPPDGQHLGAGLVEPRAAGRARLRRAGLFALRPPEKAQQRRRGDDPHRRALLHVAGLCAAARRRSGSAPCWSSRRTATSSATPARGMWTWSRTCASRCASTRRKRTSRRSITSWGTTSTSARTTRCRSCSATAPTTASTKRSATPSRCR